MPATPTQELFDETSCFCFSMGTAQRMRIGLEMRSLLAIDPGADVTAQGLLDYGACYCSLGLSEADRVELALLDQIAQGV